MRLLLSLLISLLILSPSNSEEATSVNLLPNAGTGQTSYQNSSGSIDGVNSATGWTLNGARYLTNEIEIQGTGKISANGSLVGIETTKATDGASFTTTTESLDGGVRLNSTTEVQNCEWSGSSYACGQHTSGRDSYSTTVTILDQNNSTLSTVTQNRNNDAGYYGNTYTYNDTVIYNGTGARNWNWEFSGLDGDSPNSTSLVGPNLLGAKLTVTLLDIQYSALPTTTQNELQSFKESTSKEFAKIEEELKVEKEFTLKEPEFTYEEPKLETFKQPVKTEPKVVEEEMSIETNKEEKEESPQTAESTEDNEQTQDSSESQQVSQQNSSEPKKNVSLEKTMEKIDAKVKDIGTNLGLKNIIKLKAMVDKDILSEYANKAFYQEKRIYENQADIRDNRVLYANVSLVSYTQNDPIFTKEKELFTINLEKEKLQKEIEVLKNGF